MIFHTFGGSADAAEHDQAPSNSQMLVCLLSHKQLTACIDHEDAVEFLGRDLGDVTEALNARVGNDDVEMAVVLHGFLEEVDDFGGLGNVRFEGDGFGALGFDLGDDFLGGGSAFGVVDDEGGTAFGELDGVLAAHATAGTGDEGDFAVETGGGCHSDLGFQFVSRVLKKIVR